MTEAEKVIKDLAGKVESAWKELKGEGDELIIQGDVVDNLFDVIPEKYSQVLAFF